MASTDEDAATASTMPIPSADGKGMESEAAAAQKPDAPPSWPGATSQNTVGEVDGAHTDASTPWPPSILSLPPNNVGADLPIANISRIMKRSLPDNGKIAKNAKECMQECVSELISFITSEASDRCGSEKRKTINGDDILYSLRVLGFDNYEQVLKVYLSRYRQAQEENPRQRRRRSTKTRNPNGDDASGSAGTAGEEEDGGELDSDDGEEQE